MKKTKFKIYTLICILFFLGIISSCKKDYFDINTDPNHAADVPVTLLLPSAEAAIAHAVGNGFQIFGGIWGQYWTQSPASSQYKTIDQYSPSAFDFDRPWQNMYSDALQDLSTIIAKGNATGATQYVACAKILEAYAYQGLTDNFGDVPCSQALQASAGIISPKYDTQAEVYARIITLLNEGLAAIDESAEFHPGSDDILLGGDMGMWRKFGNTLKLRVYLRLAYVDPAQAQSGVSSLSGASFLGAGDAVLVNYADAGGNYNPLYSAISDLSFVQSLVASATCVNYMNVNSDPRLPIFYAPAVNGSYVGIAQGDYTLPAGTNVSYPGDVTGGNGSDGPNSISAAAPVKLMTGYESLFLQSEAALRGWLGSGNDQALYEAAITENFEAYGLADSDATTYLAGDSIAYPASGSFDDKLRAIITQKWVSMCGNQNDEAWIEWRRTGYPDFFVQSANTIIGSGRFPQRFYYPSTEFSRNTNFPGQKQIYDKVWWDVN